MLMWVTFMSPWYYNNAEPFVEFEGNFGLGNLIYKYLLRGFVDAHLAKMMLASMILL